MRTIAKMKKDKISKNSSIRAQKIGQKYIEGECGCREGGMERSECRRVKDRGSWMARRKDVNKEAREREGKLDNWRRAKQTKTHKRTILERERQGEAPAPHAG